jgi:hypothetical protein
MKKILAPIFVVALFAPVSVGVAEPAPPLCTGTICYQLTTPYPSNFINGSQQNDPSQSITGGLNTAVEFSLLQGGNYASEGMVSGIQVLPSNGTVESTQFQYNGLAGYVENQATSPCGSSPCNAGVAVFGQARCDAADSGCRSWGANFTATDYLPDDSASTVKSILYGAEIDVVPSYSGDSVYGVASVINSGYLSGVTMGYSFLSGAHVPSAVQWDVAFFSQDDTAALFGVAGATCSSGSCHSQGIRSQYYNSGTEGNANWWVTQYGNFYFDSPIGIKSSGSLPTTLYVNGSIGAAVNAQTGTSYTIGSTDHTVTLSNSGAVAVSLPACSSSSMLGWEGVLSNLGAGIATVTPNGTDKVIGNGSAASSYALSQYHTSRITCDGAGDWLLTLY